MKKSLVAAIAGVVTCVIGSRGQGTVSFSNYNVEDSPTINYSSNPAVVPAGKAGLALGGSFAAELAWFNGVTSDESQLSLIPASITYFSFNGPGPNSTADGDIFDAGHPTGNGAGWFIGPIFGIPGAPSGTVVTFQVFAFNNGSLADATVAGHSTLFQETLGGGALPPAAGLQNNPFTVQNVPEPSVWALVGLGLGGLMAFRPKRA